MKRAFFFLPGLSERYRSGGNMVIQDVERIFSEDLHIESFFVTTHEEHNEALTPEQAFKLSTNESGAEDEELFIVTWGPLVEKHIKEIRAAKPNAKIIYYAQSFGWGIKVPDDVTIACVSHYVLGQWSLKNPRNELTYIPPPLAPFIIKGEESRSIEILVHTRKQTDYCTKKLLPALRAHELNLRVIEDWITHEEFAKLLRQSKIFLYVTGTHRAGLFRRLPAEGFGLPALEAVASGCIVASNFLGGVNDFLIDGKNAVRLSGKNIKEDIAAIKSSLESFTASNESQKIIEQYSRERVAKDWQKLVP